MGKKQIRLLSIFISIITFLLVMVQILWVESSRESKTRDFGAAVSIALDRSVDAISHEETYTQAISQVPEGLSEITGSKKNNQNITSELQTSREGLKYTTRSQQRIPLDSFSSNNSDNPYMSDSSVIELIKKGTDNAKNNLSENAINQKTVMIERIIEHIFFKIDLPIEQRVNIAQADSIIQNELRKLDILAHFELAIIGENGNILTSTPDYFSPKNENIEVFEKQLFPADPDSVEKYYLKLYFPEQNFYILQSLWMLIAASFALTILILITFIATLLIISRQKKTAEIRNSFVSNITHEFKTPIATISLAGQMLHDKNIPDAAKNISHLSEMVVNQSKKLTFLVEQILQTSIFDKGDYQLKKVPVDVHEIIKKVTSNFALQTQEKQTSIITSLEAEKNIINTDELHFSNVISNLIDNALKYSKESPSIIIKTLNKDNGILVSISDNGIGISKEYQKRIFEQFFRVPSGNVHDVKGFGLGLSYVKKVVEVLGGQIWLHSELNKGSTFYIWMPLNKNK